MFRLVPVALALTLAACTSTPPGSAALAPAPTFADLVEDVPLGTARPPGSEARIEEGRASRLSVVRYVRFPARDGRVDPDGPGSIDVFQDPEGRVRSLVVAGTTADSVRWTVRFGIDADGRTAFAGSDVYRPLPERCGAPQFSSVNRSAFVLMSARGEVQVAHTTPLVRVPLNDPGCQTSISAVPVQLHADVASLLRSLGVPPLDGADWLPADPNDPPPPRY